MVLANLVSRTSVPAVSLLTNNQMALGSRETPAELHLICSSRLAGVTDNRRHRLPTSSLAEPCRTPRTDAPLLLLLLPLQGPVFCSSREPAWPLKVCSWQVRVGCCLSLCCLAEVSVSLVCSSMFPGIDTDGFIIPWLFLPPSPSPLSFLRGSCPLCQFPDFRAPWAFKGS